MADEQHGHGYTDVLPADGGRSAEALLRRTYGMVQKLDDRLAKADRHIDWGKFRPIVSGIYRNGSEGGGRPNTDEVVMVKLLVLQQWIGCSLER
jgi:IS5 family transposase